MFSPIRNTVCKKSRESVAIAQCSACLYCGRGAPWSACQLIQVVLGHVGRCDEAKARAGLEWMRNMARREGERIRF